MRIIALANQKGGVGKTTTAVNLATAFAASGQSVILVDLDPQGNASTGFGIPRSARAPGSYELLFAPEQAPAALRDTPVPGLQIVPAGENLAGAEVELVGDHDTTARLKAAIARMPAADLLLIDCPPSLGLLTLNALVAADGVLVPLQTEFYAMEGLSQLLRTVEQVRARQNPGLDIEGILLTMYDRRNRLSEQVESDARAALGRRVFETVIPRNVRLSEAPSHGIPALIYDLSCRGSQAYMALAREMLGQMRAARPNGERQAG